MTFFRKFDEYKSSIYLLSDVLKKKDVMKERFMCEVKSCFDTGILPIETAELRISSHRKKNFPWKLTGSEMPKMPEKPSKSAEILAGSSPYLLPDLTSVSKGGDVGVPKSIAYLQNE